MKVVFQQPGTQGLLAAIDEAAANASTGSGVFAFATKGGIDELFKCPNIIQMLENGKPFHLIVGVDAITNAEALLCLSEKLALFPDSLTVDVFFHDHPSSTFHPKFSWFKQKDTLRILIGSGNLTLRGLGLVNIDNPFFGNWEVLSVQSLTGASAAAAQTEIENWLAEQCHAGRLLSQDHERVRERAMANGRVRFSSRAGKASPAPLSDAPPPRSREHATPVDDVIFDTPEVLVREIPRNRSGQADIGRDALEEFFGYKGEEKNVFVQHVSLDNTLGTVESLLLFVNKSKNYRLELRAIAALTYVIGNDDSRMILVATKLDRRSFRYTIVPVTNDDYGLVVKILGPITGGRRRMRETRVSPEALRTAWPEVPPNLLPVELLTPEP